MKNRWPIIPTLLVIIAALKWAPIDELFHLMRFVPTKQINVGTEVSIIEREGAKILLKTSSNSNDNNNNDFKHGTITVQKLASAKVLVDGNGIDKNLNEMKKYLNENEN